MADSAQFCDAVRSCNRNAQVNKEAVCRIVCDGQQFDLAKPYNKSNSTGPRTGTGFFLENVHDADGNPVLITAYHVINHAVRTRVIVESVGQNFLPARMVGANPKLDVAILSIPSLKDSKDKIQSLALGDSDACYTTQRIGAVGFALAKPWLQHTVGVCSGRTNVHLQIDAAVNGGNSGGPVVDDSGHVIGIVLAGMDKAQGINYMCPIREALMSIKRMLSGERCVQNPSLNCKLSITCPSYITHIECPSPGMRCAAISSNTPLYQAGLREGDIVTAIQDNPIDIQGRIQPQGWWRDRLPVFALLERLDCNTPTKVSFFNPQTRSQKVVNVVLGPEKQMFRKMFPEFDEVPYTAFGGLVVQPLNKNLLKENKMLAVLMLRPHLYDNSVLVITEVLPESPFAEMNTVHEGDIVLSVNGVPTNSIEAYKSETNKMLADGTPTIQLLLRSGNEVFATREQLVGCHNDIQERIKENIYLGDVG